MDGVITDLKVAMRALRSRPGFTLTAVTTLAATIGALTLLFSVVNSVILRPLPYDDPNSLVSVHAVDPALREEGGFFETIWDSWFLNLEQAQAWRAPGSPLAGIGVYQMFGGQTARVGEAAETYEGAAVDEGVFTTLGVTPAMGRLPTAREFAQGAAVAVIHHRVWRDLFGGDPAVLGRTFTQNEVSYAVIGVMPPEFFFPTETNVIWRPLSPDLRQAGQERPLFRGIGRLAGGVTVENATLGLDRIASRLGETHPALSGVGARAVEYRSELFSRVSTGIRILIGTTVMVLLMACVNLTNGLLARGIERRREFAVRAALGQGRGAMVRTALAEVGLLSVLGAGSGVLLAAVLLGPFVRALVATLGALPRWEAITIDVSVLLFTLLVTTLTAVAAGLIPALGVARRAPADTITSSRGSGTSRGVVRSQRVLLVVQAALVMILTTGTALLLRSFAQMGAVDPGYDTRGIAWAQVETGQSSNDDSGLGAVALDDLLARVRSIPGVSQASAARHIPGRDGIFLTPVRSTADGRGDVRQSAGFGHVEPSYFETMGIPILQGGTFADAIAASSAVIIDELMAQQLFGGENPIGRRIISGQDDDLTELTVVGVMASVRQLSPLQEPRPQFVEPLAANPGGTFYVVVRTADEIDGVLPLLRQALGQPGLTIEEVGTLRENLSAAFVPARLRLVLVGGLAGLAVLLALLGTFGVVSHQVSNAQREIGIRVALGAAGSQEVGRVVWSALTPTAVGVALGGLGGLLGAEVISGVLFDVPATDPVSFIGAGALILLVGFVAAWMPARRVSRVDPVEVLSAG